MDQNLRFRLVQGVILAVTATLAVLWIRNPQGSYEPWTVLGGIMLTILEMLRRSEKSSRAARAAEQAGVTVSQPGLLRYALNQYVPALHVWLTTRVGLFDTSPGMACAPQLSLNVQRHRGGRDQ